MPGENTPKRALDDIRVDEISLVDTPANEESFAIIKRADGKADDETKVKKNDEAEGDASDGDEQKAEGDGTEEGGAPTPTDDIAPAHKALLREKIAMMKKIAESIAAELGSMDSKTMRDRISALSSLSWSIRELPTEALGLTKRVSPIVDEAKVAVEKALADGKPKVALAEIETMLEKAAEEAGDADDGEGADDTDDGKKAPEQKAEGDGKDGNDENKADDGKAEEQKADDGDGKKPDENAEGDDGKKAPEQKAEGEGEEGDDDEEDEEAKEKKARVAKLNEALSTIKSIMAETGAKDFSDLAKLFAEGSDVEKREEKATALRKALDDVRDVTGEMSAAERDDLLKSIGESEKPAETKVTKKADDEVAELKKRIAQLEKAAIPKGAGGENETPAQKVEKRADDVWDGLPI